MRSNSMRRRMAGSLVAVAGAPAAAHWTVVNLHPAGSISSRAYGISDGQQVGMAIVVPFERAGVWGGTPASWLSLHPVGASHSVAFGVHGGQQGGVS